MRSVLIVEDVAETRAWLRDLIEEAFPGCRSEDAPTVRQAIGLLHRQMAFDMALIDLRLPDGSGLDVMREIRQRGLPTPCVVTTIMGEDSHVVAALAAGAMGYLVKDQMGDQVIRQLHQIREGVPALSPSVARRIMDHFRLTGPAETGPDQELTKREQAVLSLIGRGLRNAEVAVELSISENTVGGYIKTIYRKLGIGSRAEAARHAARLGI